jgi:hypothetical protein
MTETLLRNKAWQPAKFAAALQHATASGKLVSFREPGTFAEFYILCFTLALSFIGSIQPSLQGFIICCNPFFSLVIIILVTGFVFFYQFSVKFWQVFY